MRLGSLPLASLSMLGGLLVLPAAIAAQTELPGPPAAVGPGIDQLEGVYDGTLRIEPANCAGQRIGGVYRGDFRAQAGRRDLIIHLEDLQSMFAEPLTVGVDGTSLEYSGPVRVRVGPVTDSVNARLQGEVAADRSFNAMFQIGSALCRARGSIDGRWKGPLPVAAAPTAPAAEPPAAATTVDYGQAQSNTLPPPAAGDSAIPGLVGQEVSLQASNYPDRFIRHRFALGYTDRIGDETARNDATFRIVPGLAGRCISLESRNFPNHFLRHQDWRIRLAPREESNLYRQDATFCMVPGLAGTAGISLESVTAPQHYIRHRANELWVDRFDGSDLFRRDATFNVTQPGGALIAR